MEVITKNYNKTRLNTLKNNIKKISFKVVENRDLSAIRNHLNNYFELYFINDLTFSLIEGEYDLYNFDDFEKLISSIKNEISERCSFIKSSLLEIVTIDIDPSIGVTTPVFEFNLSEGNYILSKYEELLIECIDKYSILKKYIQNNNFSSSNFIVEQSNNLIFKNTFEDFDQKQNSQLETYFFIILLYKLEYTFSEDLICYKNLIRLKKAFKEINNSLSNNDIFLKKIDFLIYKWECRKYYNLKQNVANEESNNFILDFDGSEIKIDENIFSRFAKSLETTLVEWNEYIREHYFSKETGSHIELAEVRKFTNFNEVHKFIKYNKSYKQNEENLKLLIEDLELKKEKDITFKKAYLYALNNLFSLYINQFKDKDSRFNTSELQGKIQCLFDKIRLFQKNAISNNFFASLKFTQFKINLFEKEIEKLNNNEFDPKEKMGIIKNLNNSSEEIHNLISQTKKEIEWSRYHHNFIWQQPFDECFVYIGGSQKVYFPSTFVLPISISENKLKLKKAENDFNRLKIKAETYNSISEIYQIKKQLDDNNKKLLETVSIFTGIISFIVGSISAYKFLNTFIEALIFIIIFLISITIFILLILISTQGFSNVFKHSKKVGFFYGILLFIIFILFQIKYKSNYDDDYDVSKKYIDSLHKSNKYDLDNFKEKFIDYKKSS